MTSVPRCLRWALPALAAAALLPARADSDVLLDEPFKDNQHGWLVDDYAKIADGAFQIDARGKGGYYRWLNDPAGLNDFTLKVDVQKTRGNNEEPLYGLLFRVQESWRNAYFLVINGSQGYFFGKFVQGSAIVLKQGTSPGIHPGGASNTLVVRAAGNTFGLAINDTPIANVIDDTYPSGRIGVGVEAPALVSFRNLQVAALGNSSGPEQYSEESPPPSGVKTLFADAFERNTGWSEDQFRRIADGVYHLSNQGERKSFLSWHPQTASLKDFVARLDARLLEGDAKALYGVCWRVKDGAHFYFFLINPDGRYFAGVRNGDDIATLRRGTSPAVRKGDQANTLEVRAESRQFVCRVNGTEACSFGDDRVAAGCIGLYLEQPAHVTFDDLLVTDLPENAPPVVGGGAAKPLGTGKLRLEQRLDRNGAGFDWPTDENRRFDLGGYCVTAPAKGSRVVTAGSTRGTADGVAVVTARAARGPSESGFGLVVRATDPGDGFYFLTLNAQGRYFVGKCVAGQFTVIDSGPVANLRGGDSGNELQFGFGGPNLRYAVNDHALGSFRDETFQAGAVGLLAENGVTACFQNLRIYDPPRE
ncbi:MAG: hypothetical protein HYU66_10560 [Armatimonadetes bacterium]|nr:hypothetical protein [Armatimonadota bacterium]